jgi:hypothetical protein
MSGARLSPRFLDLPSGARIEYLETGTGKLVVYFPRCRWRLPQCHIFGSAGVALSRARALTAGIRRERVHRRVTKRRSWPSSSEPSRVAQGTSLPNRPVAHVAAGWPFWSRRLYRRSPVTLSSAATALSRSLKRARPRSRRDSFHRCCTPRRVRWAARRREGAALRLL